jgi:hypothetical protein
VAIFIGDSKDPACIPKLLYSATMQNVNERLASVAADTDFPDKQMKSDDLPVEVMTLLMSLSTAVSTATHDLMKIECADIAARGRVVVILAEAQRQIDAQLGVNKRVSLTLLSRRADVLLFALFPT